MVDRQRSLEIGNRMFNSVKRTNCFRRLSDCDWMALLPMHCIFTKLTVRAYVKFIVQISYKTLKKARRRVAGLPSYQSAVYSNFVRLFLLKIKYIVFIVG
jgi:hypothetical protein